MAKKPWHQWPPSLKSPDGWLRLAIYDRDGNRCSIRLPGCTVTPTALDHIIPPEEGGAWFDEHNLRGSCSGCNSKRRRGAKHGGVALPTRATQLW